MAQLHPFVLVVTVVTGGTTRASAVHVERFAFSTEANATAAEAQFKRMHTQPGTTVSTVILENVLT